MLDLDGQTSPDTLTGLAVGPQAVDTDVAHERRVAARVAQRDDLIVEGGQPEVRVVVDILCR